MKVIKPGYEMLRFNPQEDIWLIERAARNCYKSEDRIGEKSAEGLIRRLVESGHEAMLEHSQMSVLFTVDRGVSHEMVRHRLCSFAQESTRYCNYSKDKFGNEITVIEPVFYKDIPEEEKTVIREVFDNERKEPYDFEVTDLHRRYANWYTSCTVAESGYFNLLKLGATPQEARAVLPNSLKTEIVVTANLREWRKIFQLRTAKDAHPQIVEVMTPLLEEVRRSIPFMFNDI